VDISCAAREVLSFSPPGDTASLPDRGLLALDLAFEIEGDLLAIGSDAGRYTRALEREGYRVWTADSIKASLAAMVETPFAAVLTLASVNEEADGVRLVRSIKHQRSASSAVLSLLRKTFEAVPFVILPLSDSPECAVFWSETRWTLADGSEDAIPDLVGRAIALSRR